MEKLTPVQVTTSIGSIEDNLALVEESIKAKVAEYRSVVVTEQTISDEKSYVADIRKEKTALDNQRKEIKKAWMAPYEAFEARVKAIIALYDEPINAINMQLDEYEKKRIESKKTAIQDIYDYVKGDLAEWMPLERIYDRKWENKTFTEKQICEAMEIRFDQLRLSISTIRNMKSEFEPDALQTLKDTLSLNEAIATITSLNEQKERFAEQAKIQAQKEMEARLKAEMETIRQEKEAEHAEELIAENAEKQLSGAECTIPFPSDPEDGILGQAACEFPYFPDPDGYPFSTDASDVDQAIFTVTAYVSEERLDDVRMFFDSLGIEFEVR